MILKPLHRIKIFTFGLLMTHVLFADPRSHLYEQGNQFYTEGKFNEALDTYQEIIRMGYENGPLYYNIGNCYYKLGDIGRAILFYERAKKLIPSDEDLKANLAIAQLSVVDQIEPSPDFILIQAANAFFHVIPKSLQFMLMLCSYVLFMAFVILLLLSRSPQSRRIAYRLVWVSGLVFVIITVSFTGRMLHEKKTSEAIILSEKVDVMSAPTSQGGVEAFSLHEGTKVRLDRSNEDWVEIVLPDRKVGWVKKDVLEAI